MRGAIGGSGYFTLKTLIVLVVLATSWLDLSVAAKKKSSSSISLACSSETLEANYYEQPSQRPALGINPFEGPHSE
jgi:hypothetical protein